MRACYDTQTRHSLYYINIALYVIEFASRKEAAESVLGSARAVGNAIRNNMGFLWSYINDIDLPGEEWLQGNIKKHCVSNIGRIWPKMVIKHLVTNIQQDIRLI